MKSKTIGLGGVLVGARRAVTILFLLAAAVSVKAELQIDKAYCGIDRSWCDITAYLQQKVRGNSLRTDLPQPFDKIGGDPAPSQVKYMVIDYRLNQVAYRLVLHEHGPNAFEIRLPSAEAVAPGKDAAATELVKAITAPGAVTRVAQPRGPDKPEWVKYIWPGVGVAVLVGGVAATAVLIGKRWQRNRRLWPTLDAEARRRIVARRRRWQRFAFITLAVLVTLVAIFYLEEDWRGKRAWDKCVAEMEAQGVPMDWSKLVPKPVPDDQNFFTASTNILIRFKKAQTEQEMAAADAMKSNSWLRIDYQQMPQLVATQTNPLLVAIITISSGSKSAVAAGSPAPIRWDQPDAAEQVRTRLEKAVGRSAEAAAGFTFTETQLDRLKPIQISIAADTLPTVADLTALLPRDKKPGRYQVSGTADPRVLQVSLVDLHVTAMADYLRWSDQFTPACDEIREALKRPYAILPGDYSEPYLIPIPNFVTLRAFSQMLTMRAQCHLYQHNPDEALREITLIHKVCRILQKPPTGSPETLVEAMINVAITSLYVRVLDEGVQMHEWQKQHLEILDDQLNSINLPFWVVRAFKQEMAAVSKSLETASADKIADSFGMAKAEHWYGRWKEPFYAYAKLAPHGWVHQNLVNITYLKPQLFSTVDVDHDIMAPAEQVKYQRRIDRIVTRPTPFNILAVISTPNYTKAIQTTAHNQNMVNEARIACALERYRQIDGEYPASLEALVPQFINPLPHDIIGGQPLHYRRTEDGKFLLYSVGWNERDDGGKKGKDFEQGDWVWPE